MENFNFKKKFGQNFISDKNLLKAIVSDAKVEKTDCVLEIGAGAGALTKALSEAANCVVSYEIDQELKSTLENLNLKNVKFIFSDFLKQKAVDVFSELENFKKIQTETEKCEKISEKIEKNGKKIEKIENSSQKEVEREKSKNQKNHVKVVANLPYYVTSPIIFKILEEFDFVDSITCMVQKEVAERVCAKEGSRDYGVLSVIVALYGCAQITREVSRNMFFPKPNVDSAVLHIEIENKFENVDKKAVSDFVKLCFSMRRKTLLNNLSKKYSKNLLTTLLPPEVLSRRAESFSVEEFIEIFKKLEKIA